jgi:hypothetical protein
MYGMDQAGLDNRLMKVMINTFLIIICCFSCNQIKRPYSVPNDSPPCSDKILFQNLIQRAVNIDKKYLMTDVDSVIRPSKDIFILKNKFFTDTTKINNRSIIIISNEEINKQKIVNYIEFEEINYIEDTANVSIRYNSVNWFIYAILIKNECDWKIIKAYLEQTKDKIK